MPPPSRREAWLNRPLGLSSEGLFCEIYVCPASLQGDEKMKPIFSTEQARYQKFASFFIDVTGISRSAERGYFALCGERQGLCPLTPPPFEKGGRKLSRLGSAVNVYLLSALAQLLVFTLLSPLAQLFVFARCRPRLSL